MSNEIKKDKLYCGKIYIDKMKALEDDDNEKLNELLKEIISIVLLRGRYRYDLQKNLCVKIEEDILKFKEGIRVDGNVCFTDDEKFVINDIELSKVVNRTRGYDYILSFNFYKTHTDQERKIKNWIREILNEEYGLKEKGE